MIRSILFFCCLSLTAIAQKLPPGLPVWKTPGAPASDWLIRADGYKAAVFRSADGKDLILSNGLLMRRIRIAPNAATVEFRNLTSGEQFIRAVRPEARLVLDGKTVNVGGLYGQKQQAYLLNEWVDGFTAHDADFFLKEATVSPLKPAVNWKSSTWAPAAARPAGQTLTLTFGRGSLQVDVQYDLYDGIPLIAKRLSIRNQRGTAVSVDGVVNEILAVPEEESAVVGSPEQMKKPSRIYIESNYAFNNAMKADLSDQTTHWKTDSTYTSQVNYNYQTPCVLEVHPPIGPGIALAPGETFESIRTYELLLDSYDRERNGLAKRRMYNAIAPWIRQNPIFMHLVSTDPVKVREIIDQCAETGYEMVILSFGSGLNMEDTSAANIAKFKALADYAHSKKILLGGYSLFSSRRISDADDVIDPKTGLPDKHAMFGAAACLGSNWGLAYLKKLKTFITQTGFDLLEHDGPYPGDVCASTNHPGHKGLHDSQWTQMEMQKGFYRWLNERGVYVNAPDWYFLDGSHKIALGYREVNFSLPRPEQKILNRQNIFDGTWEKTPSMGWGFVPLTKYQGGGPEAILEPLNDHLEDYKQLMVQYYGAGVQACYRGPRLYDTEATKKVVKEVVGWYKQNREILNSDIIHLRRPDGREWDGILHVNPSLPTKGMALLYNPLKEKITRTIRIPLYYTGLEKQASIRIGDGKAVTYPLNRSYEAVVQVDIAPGSYTTLTVQ
ncbi:MAG: alpha-galactosidase [Siphonobacter aquaeclarae]|nr:alpha-galactosidase [Siphonobacter aquaeclarae]